MKNRKWIALLMAFVLVLGLTACGGDQPEESAESTTEQSETAEAGEKEAGEEEAGEKEAGKIEWDDDSLYLITDLGTIDDKGFNQSAYEGLKMFAEKAGVKANYLRPQGEGDQNYKQAIEQAIAKGAKVIVTPGFLFENSVGEVQSEYPDVYFIAADFEPKVQDGDKVDEEGQPVMKTKIDPNTVSVLFKEQQSGYLAGYATVKDGYKDLGFMGGLAVPAVVRYGTGFVAGADAAAKELGETVNVKYNYTNFFVAQPEIQTKAASWYNSGTEIIFSCGGGIVDSILKAAKENDGKVIGVDVDQYDLGEEVVTSAMKNLATAVNDEIQAIDDGTFEGGKSLVFGVTEDGVQLADEFDRFKTFTEEDYKTLYENLKANKDGMTDAIPDIAGTFDTDEFQAKYENVKIEFIK